MNYVRLGELRHFVMKPRPVLHRLWCRLGENKGFITVCFLSTISHPFLNVNFILTLFLRVDLNLALINLTARYNNLLL